MQLMVEVYKTVQTFPLDDQYGIGKQMKRTSISIPSNIAEGWGRSGNKSFHYFLTVSRGSNCELETQTIGAKMLGLVREDHVLFKLIGEVGKMLNSLIQKVEIEKNKN